MGWSFTVNHLLVGGFKTSHSFQDRASCITVFISMTYLHGNLRIFFAKAPTSPTLFLVAKELPKDALIEKQVLVHTGRCPVVDDGEVTLQKRVPLFEQGYYYSDLASI